MTIRDVATHSGVSVSTVSRVLNNHPDVSDDARRRVLAAVSELHYVPNSTARDLVAPPVDTIGVVVRGAENPFYTPIIHAMEDSCERAGYTMVLHQITADADEVGEAATLVRAKRLRGLVFLGGRFDYTHDESASIGVPFVCCTNNNDFGDLPTDGFSSVSINDVEIGRRATQALIDAGHTVIAIVLDTDHDRSISQLRLAGYRQALEAAGIAFDAALVVQTGDFTMEAAYRATGELLRRRGDVSALFVVADAMAIAAMRAIHDAGLTVPGDISLIAVDGIEVSRYLVPALTTFAQPQEALGREAIAALVNVLEGTGETRHVRLEATLRSGATCAPPRGRNGVHAGIPG